MKSVVGGQLTYSATGLLGECIGVFGKKTSQFNENVTVFHTHNPNYTTLLMLHDILSARDEDRINKMFGANTEDVATWLEARFAYLLDKGQ